MASLATLPMCVVDAFAARAFSGNPAAVVDFGDAPFLPDGVLQAIARENNLAETAFVRRSSGGGAPPSGAAAAPPPRFHLRWFTPLVEINLCGHATLATAKVLLGAFPSGAAGQRSVTFDSLSGPLTVTRGGGELLTLDFPAWMPAEVAPSALPPALLAGLGLRAEDVLWAGKNRDYTLVLRSPAAVAAVRVDSRALDQVADATVCIVAAAGDGAHHLPSGVRAAGGAPPDFVSRAFCPKETNPEDPVCGSAHCSLIPVFAQRLGKAEGLLAHQLSARGGELHCSLVGDRVRIAGTAIVYMRGAITVPAAL